MKNIILISTFLIFLSTSVSASTVPNIQEIRISLDSVWVVIGGDLGVFHAGRICIDRKWVSA